jgi:hypothetical protein
MKRPVWFRRRTWGAGWTPCSWQGCLVTVLCLALSLAALYWGPGWDTKLYVLGVFGPVGLLAAIAFLTEDTAG